MFATRIPKAENYDEQMDELIMENDRNRYFIEKRATGQICATGLTRRQVVEFMWMADGGDYELRPRMGTLYDALGNNTGIERQLEGLLGPEWDVYFKKPNEIAWGKSRITAYGPTKRKATIRLLDQAFWIAGWPNDTYFAISDRTTADGLAISRQTWSKLDPKTAQHWALQKCFD